MAGTCMGAGVPRRRGGSTPAARRRVRRQAGALPFAAALALAIAGCGSGGTGGNTTSTTTLTVAMVEAFTGANSIDGIAAAAGCYPAARVVNQSGGVLGHKIQCVPVDTRGDPTDAIPAVEKLLATTSGLVGVAGPESGTAAAIVPILTKAHIPMISQNGLSLYDRNTDPYFWRNYPADDLGGVALAYWAHHAGYNRAALFFDNSVAAQGSVPGLLRTYQRLGGQVVINLSVPPGDTSYGSEIHRLIQAHPQVIFTESDPQTDATAFGNLVQFGARIPIFGTNATVIPQWLKVVNKALGSAEMATYYRGVEPYAPNFPGTRYFNHALLADAKQVPQPSQWLGQEYATAPFDGLIIYALAMTEAHSTNPAVFNRDILSVTAPGPGKTVVYTYRAGVAALKAGKRIQYVGAGGPTIFNRWHDATGEYGVYQYVNGKLKLAGTISAAALAAASGG
ncbi:MAG TPA: ABC transporter substrate-binding protein [Streptosporangiaceae bacterium]|nr:ABC transporter substrate-binding protein [Streptosporangiaceae bacterium]